MLLVDNSKQLFLLKTILGKIKSLIIERPESLINTVFNYIPYDKVFLCILLILKPDLNMSYRVPDKNPLCCWVRKNI